MKYLLKFGAFLIALTVLMWSAVALTSYMISVGAKLNNSLSSSISGMLEGMLEDGLRAITESIPPV